MNANEMIKTCLYNLLRPVVGNKQERHQGHKHHQQETGANIDENHALIDLEKDLIKVNNAAIEEAKLPENLVAN